MLAFSSARFDYEPYPIGLVRPVLDAAFYDRLVATYPDPSLFEFKPLLGNKYSLSELNHPRHDRRFIESADAWARFHAHVKGDAFIPEVFDFFARRDIDLGIRRFRVSSRKPWRSGSSVWTRIRRRRELSARFEFSMMSSDGGHLLPHTDAAQKIVTLVFSMIAPGEWNPAWGGGTAVVLPKDRSKIYNQVNRSLPFDQVDVLKTWELTPNQCLVFVKTYNSWHAVSPMRGAGGRRCGER